MKKLLLIPVVALSIFAFSCKSTDSVAKGEEVKTEQNESGNINLYKAFGEWKLSEMVLNGVPQRIYDSDLIIQKGKKDTYLFAGFSGVNRYNGDVKIDGKGFISGQAQFLSTKMAGPEYLMNFEDNFLSILTSASKVNISENLELLDIQSESKLVFVKK